jgi:uncharacterized protein (TIGR00159 family)
VLEGLAHLFSARPVTLVLRDLADILIVTFLTYRALLVLKGTRAMQMGIGVLAFGLLYLVAKFAELTTVLSLLSWLATSAILIIVVVFQNDIRRALIRLGAKAWLTRGRDAQERVIDEVVAATTELARHRMGALICLERDANVLEFVKSEGIALDCEVTRELLVSLFVPEAVNKLHDGAVLIRDLKVACAGVFLPMPEVTKVADHSLGSRHRAAIGITEETDAVVVVVSEERGTITLCFPNGMVQNVDGTSLKQALLGLFGRATRREQRSSERTQLERSPQSATDRSGRFTAPERPTVRSGPPEDDELGEGWPAQARASLATPRRLDVAVQVGRAPEILEEEEPPASRLSLTKPMEPTELRGHLDITDEPSERDSVPGAGEQSTSPPPGTVRDANAPPKRDNPSEPVHGES